MKIAFIVNQSPVLSETFILNQITGLMDRGHKVDVYAKWPSAERKMHLDLMRYNLLKSTYYWCLPDYSLLSLLRRACLAFVMCLKRPWIIRKAFNKSRYGTFLSSLKLLYFTAAYSQWGARKYEIIHCQFGNCGILGMFLRDIGLLKGKLVVSFHGFDISREVQQMGSGLYKQLFESGDLFLPICEYFKRRLVSLGCDEKKITVHRSGIDLQRFSDACNHFSTNGKVKIMTIGRLVEKKGIEHGIEAVARVMATNKNINYTIVGDGPLKGKLIRLVRKLKMQGTIIFTGDLRQGEIKDLLKDAHILLAPSITARDGNQEGIPVVLMEAMAMGIPVVSTLHSGIPELVQDNQSGFLVPEKDVKSLVEKIQCLIEHRSRWREMGAKGRATVKEKHDINRLNDTLVELYRQQISG